MVLTLKSFRIVFICISLCLLGWSMSNCGGGKEPTRLDLIACDSKDTVYMREGWVHNLWEVSKYSIKDGYSTKVTEQFLEKSRKHLVIKSIYKKNICSSISSEVKTHNLDTIISETYFYLRPPYLAKIKDADIQEIAKNVSSNSVHAAKSHQFYPDKDSSIFIEVSSNVEYPELLESMRIGQNPEELQVLFSKGFVIADSLMGALDYSLLERFQHEGFRVVLDDNFQYLKHYPALDAVKNENKLNTENYHLLTIKYIFSKKNKENYE